MTILGEHVFMFSFLVGGFLSFLITKSFTLHTLVLALVLLTQMHGALVTLPLPGVLKKYFRAYMAALVLASAISTICPLWRHIQEHLVYLTKQWVKILYNHHQISNNPQMI